MQGPSPSPDRAVILAAGGIVIDDQAGAPKIALIQRERYGKEIALPKGKLIPPEELSQAAVREVKEETGCTAEIRELAGTTHYRVKGVPKCVFYFVMKCIDKGSGGPLDRTEVKAVTWHEPREALTLLTHPDERNLVAAVFGIVRPAQFEAGAKRRFLRSPERERLGGAIAETWTELDGLIYRAKSPTLADQGARTVSRYLLQADAYAAKRDLHQGWVALAAARRALLALASQNSESYRLHLAALALYREATPTPSGEKPKITGWRAEAIKDLICKDGKVNEALAGEPARVIEALALRDEHLHTQYFKIELRRKHLQQLCAALGIGILLCVWLSFREKLPKPFGELGYVIPALLFGALGAALSVSRSLLLRDVSAKIPMQRLGAFAIWVRPMIGAVSALAALAFLYANEQLKIFAWKATDPAVIVVICFVAGFCERFIVGAIDKLSLKSSPDS